MASFATIDSLKIRIDGISLQQDSSVITFLVQHQALEKKFTTVVSYKDMLFVTNVHSIVDRAWEQVEDAVKLWLNVSEKLHALRCLEGTIYVPHSKKAIKDE